MVLDIGGGTTEIAVISLGSMVVWRSVRIGGYEMDDALVSHMKREHGLEIGDGRAEQLKIEIGSAAEVADEETEVNGRDLRSGGLRTATVNGREVHEALTQTVGQIIDAVRVTLEETPPELSADISDHGIVLAGGGVLLRDFPQRLRAETRLPVQLVAEPLTCVAVGAGRCLDEFGAIAWAAKPPKRRRHPGSRLLRSSWRR
jgi:rod shape-determining protein MreB